MVLAIHVCWVKNLCLNVVSEQVFVIMAKTTTDLWTRPSAVARGKTLNGRSYVLYYTATWRCNYTRTPLNGHPSYRETYLPSDLAFFNVTLLVITHLKRTPLLSGHTFKQTPRLGGHLGEVPKRGSTFKKEMLNNKC